MDDPLTSRFALVTLVLMALALGADMARAHHKRYADGFIATRYESPHPEHDGHCY